MKKTLSLILALCMAVSMSAIIFAGEVTTSGGTGTTTVSLITTKDGSFNGDLAATAMSVTVPTSFPLAMNPQGDVVSADNCRIVNNSYGAVRVRMVGIEASSGWYLTAFGPKSSLASEKVDSHKFGFSIKLGSGTAKTTDSSDAGEQMLISAPETGCYMTGAGDTAGNSVNIAYSAIVAPVSDPYNSINIANVMFIIEWDRAN